MKFFVESDTRELLMIPSMVDNAGLLTVRIFSIDSFIDATTVAGMNQSFFVADELAMLITLSIAAARFVISFTPRKALSITSSSRIESFAAFFAVSTAVKIIGFSLGVSFSTISMNFVL